MGTKEEKEKKVKTDKKAAAEKRKADKKAAAEKRKADKKAAAEKKAADKVKTGLAKAKYVGKELKIELSDGSKFAGPCICERNINGGEQVLLRIKGQGQPSRFFNVEDIVK